MTDEPGNGAASRWFALLLVAVAFLLLLQIGEQTKWVKDLRLAAQPRMLPLLALSGMLIFAATAAAITRGSGQARDEIRTWLRPGEYLLYFMLYVGAVRTLGYGFSTVLFCPLLAWRAGCGQRLRIFAALFGFGIVLFFKGILSVKIPGADWYDVLPPAVSTFLILNF